LLRLLMSLDASEPDEAGYAAVLLSGTSIGKIVIVSVKNRWKTPSSTGWHDGRILFYFEDDPNQHICELQLVHNLLNNVRKGMGAHKTYSQYRSAEELSLATDRGLYAPPAVVIPDLTALTMSPPVQTHALPNPTSEVDQVVRWSRESNSERFGRVVFFSLQRTAPSVKFA
jgi:hypothetical protein